MTGAAEFGAMIFLFCCSYFVCRWANYLFDKPVEKKPIEPHP